MEFLTQAREAGDPRFLGGRDTGNERRAQKTRKGSQQGGSPLKLCPEALR